MTAPSNHHRPNTRGDNTEEYPARVERATRGLLELNMALLEQMEKKVGLTPLRALRSLDRRGPSMVGELGDDLGLLPSTASRLSDRLADAGLITRRPSPTNRRSTLLELTDSGRAVLEELIALRTRALGAVADRMSNEDRAALIQGTHAFTAAQRRLSDQSRKQRTQAKTRASP
jgi:DNA-binding MarR family transcriptional regulator